MSLQIENLILSNRHLIKKALQLKPHEILCDNPYFQRKTTRHQGCQVDYLILTKFNTLYICEIKFSKTTIGSAVIGEMEEKIKRLNIPRHFSYRCVLIHASEVSEQVQESHFFSHLINFADLISGSSE